MALQNIILEFHSARDTVAHDTSTRPAAHTSTPSEFCFSPTRVQPAGPPAPPGHGQGRPPAPAVTRDGLQHLATKKWLPSSPGLLETQPRFLRSQPQPRFPRLRGLLGTSAQATAPLPGRLRGRAKRAPPPGPPRALMRFKMALGGGRPSPPCAQAFPFPAGGASPARRAGGAEAGREESGLRGLEHRRRSPAPVPQPGVRRRRHGRPRATPRGWPARGGCSASAALNPALLRGDRRAGTWRARRSRRPPPSPAAVAVGRVGHGPS